MAALFTILSVALFAGAMALYAVNLNKTRKPISYFGLIEAAKQGDRIARVILLLWNCAIAFAAISAVLSLIKFFK